MPKGRAPEDKEEVLEEVQDIVLDDVVQNVAEGLGVRVRRRR